MAYGETIDAALARNLPRVYHIGVGVSGKYGATATTSPPQVRGVANDHGAGPGEKAFFSC